MKKTTLKLSRETIRTLTHDHLARLAGGVPPTYTGRCTDWCTDDCAPESDHCQITVGCHTFGPECVSGL
jgi:hypothetical protein